METICEMPTNIYVYEHMNGNKHQKKIEQKNEHNPITVCKKCPMKTVSKNTYTQQSEAEAERERVEKQHLNLAIVLNDNAQLLFEATIRKRCRMKAKNAIPPKNIPIPFT